MRYATFDTLARALPLAPSRRNALRLIASSALGIRLLGSMPTAAKKKKKKKTTLCLDGQTIQASKKKKKKLLKNGATVGACPPPPPPGCTANCAGKPCGTDDGCGGTCGCGAGTICHGGVCQNCTVTCGENGAACAAALQEAVSAGGTVYACPGRYAGNFELGVPITLVGAGDGADPASSTILDANQSGRVLLNKANVESALHNLRITGGNIPNESGGGINTLGTLTLTACTIDKNSSIAAGGIFHPSVATGPLTLNRCVVSRNDGLGGPGGGIFNGSGATLAINGSALTGNKATQGGGLLNGGGTVIFNSASSVTGNTATLAGSGGGIHNFVGGTVALNGADVSGNTPLNCVNVPGCVG